MIIGTGTGGGISINQKVLTGKNNIAGEWGHISLPNRSDDEKKLNVQKKQSLKSAIDLGIAMQLTNISRDVMEDKKNNRSYINESFEDIKTTIKLSETFYENSFCSIKEIPLSFRFSILVARRVYRKIGYKILNKKK